MSEKRTTMSPELVQKHMDTLTGGVDSITGLGVWVMGKDSNSGQNCCGGGISGSFDIRELEGLHMSIMRAFVIALVRSTNGSMTPQAAEDMLVMATIIAGGARMYSSTEGQTDLSMETEEKLGGEGAERAKRTTAEILQLIQGSKTDRNLN